MLKTGRNRNHISQRAALRIDTQLHQTHTRSYFWSAEVILTECRWVSQRRRLAFSSCRNAVPRQGTFLRYFAFVVDRIDPKAIVVCLECAANLIKFCRVVGREVSNCGDQEMLLDLVQG